MQPQRRAFTLIELLVVIAVLALLVTLIVPALAHARATAQATICASNMNQLGKAANLYGHDFKDQIWPQYDWTTAQYTLIINGQQITREGTGVAYTYVQDVDKATECPRNKRKGLAFSASENDFRGVRFDYTMVGRVQGLRLGAPVRMAYLTNPAMVAAGTKPPLYLANQTLLTPLSGILLFVEESLTFNNDGITDGLWGNGDQITRRHFGHGTAVFAEGHAGPLKTPQGPKDEVREPLDFDCNDLYVNGRGSRWVRLEPNNADNRTNFAERPFAWINGPR